ncbi:MAG: hypothetical protein WAN69_15270 [Candidatus Korobacteraceae bacterium]
MPSYPQPVSLYTYQFVNDLALGGNCNAQAYIMFREPANDRPGQVNDLVLFTAVLDSLNGDLAGRAAYPASGSSANSFGGASWNATGIQSIFLEYSDPDGNNVIVDQNQISIGNSNVALGQWVFDSKYTVSFPLHKVPQE